MSTHLLKLFTEDDRAVAPIIGFILLFGILSIAFAGYQAERVPQQNAETEFQHYQDVQNDLIVVRNAISRAGQQNQSQFESVRLGTNYRERILALNPPDPTGTLRTSDSYPITIEEGEIGEEERTPIAASPIPTRFLTYQNGYNELEVAPIQYDNSVLYLSDPDGDEAVVFEEQNLVRDNGDVVLTALQNPFDRSATGRVTIELYPTASAPATLPDGTLTITIPTKLSADYWTDALAQTTLDEANYNVLNETEVYSEAEDVRGLELQVTADDLVFNTVGISSAPEGSNSPTTGIGNVRGEAGQCAVGSNINSNTLQIPNFQTFETQANGNNNRWRLKELQVQDDDGDSDLDQVKFEITDSDGTPRATETLNISGQDYQLSGNIEFYPDDSSYTVKGEETYTLTATACDTDGNSLTKQINS